MSRGKVYYVDPKKVYLPRRDDVRVIDVGRQVDLLIAQGQIEPLFARRTDMDGYDWVIDNHDYACATEQVIAAKFLGYDTIIITDSKYSD